MKQILLATTLIVVPIGVFAAVEHFVLPAAPPPATAQATAAPLGDLSGLDAIAADTARLVDANDLKGATARITDFETAWDEAQPKLQPMDPAAWGTVDAAADGAISALRAASPDPQEAAAKLAALSDALAHPAAVTGGSTRQVAGIDVTDPAGHPLPCEAMLKDLRTALSDGRIAGADVPTAKALQSQAFGRCNADDDAGADRYTAQALALAK
ncbi:hypothetical protein [Oceaniglobus roseus]|uniref:hypothetical protein n=1 Tax=Oceaniglobus roseus TaxID=1737570 RepID=UPI001C12C72F|nr:hypothetical protein [Kandeliimicrobium roseum]